MNVLSLFDGMSCGQIALSRAGIEISKYYASEIDRNAIKVTKKNFPKTVQLGDVRDITYRDGILYIKDEKYTVGKIALLIGGSPCTNFSFSGNRKGMSTKENVEILDYASYLENKEAGFEFIGQSYLFWEYLRLLKEIKPDNFLLENVQMANKWEDVLSKAIGVVPISINSSLVSAQNRTRLFWTNIANIKQPQDKGILLNDILEKDKTWNKAVILGRRLNKEGKRKDMDKTVPLVQCLEVRATNRDKSNCLTTVAKDNVLTPLAIGRHSDVYGKKLPHRVYSLKECCRLQTISDNYCDCVSTSQAKKMLGNGWTVDVIAHIFKNIEKKVKINNYLF